ncbi:MAG: phosphoribosylformylglycinamidine cyclo-ligase [bacterium]
MKSKNARSRYESRGVSSSKEDVHNAIRHLDKGLFPGAFCKILPDVLAGNPKYCNIQHADGAGTKSSLGYLWWKKFGDLSVWKGIIRDSLFMNFDDVGCAGGVGPFLVSLTIDRNKALIPGEVIAELINACQEVCDLLTSLGVPCVFSGGETADVGDLVRTITVDNTVTVRFKRKDVIDAGRIKAPAYIVGFSSTGQAKWETEPNSGMGSNGLTNARHDLLLPVYRKFKETYAPETDKKLIYCGKYYLDDHPLPGDLRFTVGSALLSPTRTYLPLMAKLFKKVGRKHILGLIHCSGGGQTKCGKFGQTGIAYVKDNLFPMPPLFQLLKDVRSLSWLESYASYNMGHRLEAVVKSGAVADECIAVAGSCGIEARVIGRVVANPENPKGREVRITNPEGSVIYYPFE